MIKKILLSFQNQFGFSESGTKVIIFKCDIFKIELLYKNYNNLLFSVHFLIFSLSPPLKIYPQRLYLLLSVNSFFGLKFPLLSHCCQSCRASQFHKTNESQAANRNNTIRETDTGHYSRGRKGQKKRD